MIYTIGHSTRSFDEFLSLLQEQAVVRLGDVRRYPGSRRHPQFSSESLADALRANGVEYIHLPELGGRRKPRTDSPNVIWRNDQFRGYADHMATEEFRGGIEKLLASEKRTAVMCAEGVPWRCHRNLLADELVRRGIEVLHIIGPGSNQPHTMNPAARDAGGHLVYSESQGTLSFGSYNR